MRVSFPASVFFIDNLLVRIHFIIVIVRGGGLAPWEFEFPFLGSLASMCGTGGRLVDMAVEADVEAVVFWAQHLLL